MHRFWPSSLAALWLAAAGGEEPRHVVVAREPGSFLAWPANGGLWTWDDGQEALVAFVSGAFVEQPGHNIGPRHTNRLARSRDGGSTWTVEQPTGFAQPGATFGVLTHGLDFTGPGFALRCTATGYHGAEDGRGGFLCSTDRGRSWRGPFRFAGLDGCAELRGWELTCRTDYLVDGPAAALVLLSARTPGKGGTDRTFWARTTDGGQRWRFGGWVVGRDDPFRAVMPATVRLSPTRLVTALRRRALDREPCWLDAWRSDDNGATWRFVSRIGETGVGNGNPPALLRLRDGRLCCAYGNRSRRQMLASLSRDDGATWDPPLVLRDGFRADRFGDADFGYPRQFQRADGQVVTIYYWSQNDAPESCIAATIWTAPGEPR
jgi:hypothetical protein